jgi:hypothetical protein
MALKTKPISEFAIGIDPGLKGAIVLIEKRHKGFALCHVAPMPLTKDESEIAVRSLVALLQKLGPKSVTMERAVACAFSFRGGGRQSVASGFTCGLNFGRITGALDLIGFPTRLVYPTSWTRHIHKGHEGESKEKSLAAFRKLCTPGSQGLATFPRCRVPHNGVIDAALIAYWGMTNDS